MWETQRVRGHDSVTVWVERRSDLSHFWKASLKFATTGDPLAICTFAIRGFISVSWRPSISYPRRRRSCRAGPLSCARSFTDSPHHFDSGDYKLRPLMMYDSENPRVCYTFPVLRIFNIRDDSQECNSRAQRETPVLFQQKSWNNPRQYIYEITK
jgi:hypothetical protein